MASQVAHILVGGGTGFVGRHLAHCLRESGAKVKIITRRIDSGPHHVTWNQIRDHGLPKETTAVVNIAGRNILDPTFWTDSYKRDVHDSRIETNRILVEAIGKNSNKNIKAFVTISGVGYYEPSDTKEYDENWTQEGAGLNDNQSDYLMKLAKEWEASSVLENNNTTRRVVIRSGVVLGPDGGIIKQLKIPFLLGLGGPVGTGNQWFPWIHINDLANMFKFSLFNDNVTGVLNGVADEQIRNREFAQAFAKALNRPSLIPLPSFVVSKVFGNERAGILLNGQRVKSRASSLGFKYEFTTIQEACLNCVKPSPSDSRLKTPTSSAPPPPPSPPSPPPRRRHSKPPGPI